MSEPRRALVLHLSGANEPLLIAISPATGEELAPTLPDLIRAGDVVTITAANGTDIAVNFAHVLAAHVDNAPGLGQIYGSKPMERWGDRPGGGLRAEAKN